MTRTWRQAKALYDRARSRHGRSAFPRYVMQQEILKMFRKLPKRKRA